MYYDVLNATVLFLGTTVAVLCVSRTMLNIARDSGFKRLQVLEGSIRAQARLDVIAACQRAEISAQAAGSNANRAAPVAPVVFRTGYATAVQRNVRAENQTHWIPARLRTAGYTVVELMSSLTVVAILCGLSVPGMTGLMLDTRAKTAAIDVYSTMVYARSEAIKRNANVDVIPNGGNWKNGWTVQVGGTVLKTVAPATSGLDDITAPATLTYSGDGRLTDPGTITYVISVTGNANVMARRVIVDTGGRASIRQGLS